MLGDNGYVGGFACAAKCGKSIDAMEYHSHSGPSIALFSYLGHNVGDFLLTGKAPAPLERTYLTTGVLEAAMISHGNGGKVVETPLLEIPYSPCPPVPATVRRATQQRQPRSQV